MAIPEEIRRVARPKNTVVVLSGSNVNFSKNGTSIV